MRLVEVEEAAEAGEALSRLMERVSYLQARLRDSNWAELSRLGFLKEAPDCLDRLTGIRKNFEELHHYARENKDLDFAQSLHDFKKVEGILEKNIEFEEKKQSNLKEVHLQLKEENPETFASLQQSILSLLLKARFLLERTQLYFERTAPSAVIAKDAGERKELVELLEEKESELQALREKYDRVRKQTFLGFQHEENAAELEHELEKQRVKLERERKKFEGMLSSFRSKISMLQAEFMELNDQIEGIESIYAEFSDKSSELVMLLKKERDYAKKTLLDIENEALQLRAKYSRELLKLEESKASAREEAFAESKKLIQKLQEELEDKEEMLRHFRELAKRKDRESRELEEKLAYVNAAMKARELDKKHTGKKKARKKKK